jgi:hypothetical protein
VEGVVDLACDVEQLGTPYVLLAVRTLVDPVDPADVAATNALPDQLSLRAESDEPFVLPEYDEASFMATRNALLELAKGLHGFEHAFGTADRVDPIRHLIATAAGWGGLPDEEAMYLNVNPGLPVGAYKLTVHDVPVDAFWSISLYNAPGTSKRTTQRQLGQQRHRPAQRRRLGHGVLRRLRRQPAQLSADHGRLELHRSPADIPRTAHPSPVGSSAQNDTARYRQICVAVISVRSVAVADRLWPFRLGGQRRWRASGLFH